MRESERGGAGGERERESEGGVSACHVTHMSRGHLTQLHGNQSDVHIATAAVGTEDGSGWRRFYVCGVGRGFSGCLESF